MSEEVDEYENDHKYCLRCEAEFIGPFEEDAIDEVWSNPDKGFQRGRPILRFVPGVRLGAYS